MSTGFHREQRHVRLHDHDAVAQHLETNSKEMHAVQRKHHHDQERIRMEGVDGWSVSAVLACLQILAYDF
jgi:hypothetical protein